MPKKKPSKPNLILWTPRVLAVAFNAFIALFALDIFSEGYNLIETSIGLFMHLIPNFILTAITYLSWKKPLAGSIAFALLALTFSLFFKTYREPITFLLISGPVFLLSTLFYLSHRATASSQNKPHRHPKH